MPVIINKSGSIPFFSVIMCSFNRAGTLPRAVNSLINQSIADWECVIVDDGSTDKSFEYIKNIIRSDSRFRYLYHSGRGRPALAKNAGVLAASGALLTFLDSDDEYLPAHLELRRKTMLDNPGVELLHGGFKIIGDEFVPDMNDPGRKISIYDCIVGGTFVTRKETAIAAGGFDNVDYGEDRLFYEKYRKSGFITARIDNPTYLYYRNSEDSVCFNYKG
ncbi:MAG: glycosyltransferase family 2 protein [Bacteroidota bacterium]